MIYKVVYKYSVPVYIMYTFYIFLYTYFNLVLISSVDIYSTAHKTEGQNRQYRSTFHIHLLPQHSIFTSVSSV